MPSPHGVDSWYAVAVMAQKTLPDGKILSDARPVAIRASSETEAQELVMALALNDYYPLSEWYNLQASAVRVPVI